jgi:hypothetical protein
MHKLQHKIYSQITLSLTSLKTTKNISINKFFKPSIPCYLLSIADSITLTNHILKYKIKRNLHI